MQKLTHFITSKTDLKFLWGNLWASPPQPFGRVAIAPITPMQSAPMPIRTTGQKQTLRRAGECTKVPISRSTM